MVEDWKTVTTNSYSSNDLIPLSVPFLPVNLVNSPKPLGSFLPPTLLPLPLPLPLLAVTVEAAAKSQCHESMMILPSFSSSGPNNPASHLTLPYLILSWDIQKKENRHQKRNMLSIFWWCVLDGPEGEKGGNFFKKKWSNRITRVETWVFLKTKIRETKPERDLLRRRVLGS